VTRSSSIEDGDSDEDERKCEFWAKELPLNCGCTRFTGTCPGLGWTCEATGEVEIAGEALGPAEDGQGGEIKYDG
jgi:hypothetical protein